MRLRSNLLKCILLASGTHPRTLTSEIKFFLTDIAPVFGGNHQIFYKINYNVTLHLILLVQLIFAINKIMSFGRSLSPAQIQYLRIGPKAGGSSQTKKQLTQAIRQEKNKQFTGDVTGVNSLNKIPKLTYGEFEKTVNNFGVLINKNFGNETIVHQSQKFGNIAKHINTIMLQEKDKPIFNEKKNALLKKIKDRSDNRTSIKSVYDFMGQKLHVTLKSFCLQSQKSNEGGLPIPYLRFLINHVNSSRLVKIIQTAIKAQGNQIVVQFDKIESRASHFSNNEAKYQNQVYQFERLGQMLKISLPCIEFHEPESDYKQKVYILNKEITEIIECNFDNVADIVDKYLDAGALQASIEGFKAEDEDRPQISHQEQERREYDGPKYMAMVEQEIPAEDEDDGAYKLAGNRFRDEEEEEQNEG